MKIIISHDQESIDPSESYTEEQFCEVREALEKEYEAALKKEFPEAEIEFIEGNDPRSIRVEGTGMNDPSGIEDEVQRMCEIVFETGLFWS